jgi:hypothetical protein
MIQLFNEIFLLFPQEKGCKNIVIYLRWTAKTFDDFLLKSAGANVGPHSSAWPLSTPAGGRHFYF